MLMNNTFLEREKEYKQCFTYTTNNISFTYVA